MAEKLGARAKRIAEREFRGQLEQAFEGKLREQLKPMSLKNARSATGWMQRRPIVKPVGD